VGLRLLAISAKITTLDERNITSLKLPNASTELRIWSWFVQVSYSCYQLPNVLYIILRKKFTAAKHYTNHHHTMLLKKMIAQVPE
jgi:hypothetical protein